MRGLHRAARPLSTGLLSPGAVRGGSTATYPRKPPERRGGMWGRGADMLVC